MDDRHTPTIAEFAQMLERRFRRHRAWQIGVTCLSSIVVFATVYMLVLPAVTLESSNEVPGIELLANGEQEGEKNEGEKNVEDVESADDGSEPESPESSSDGNGVPDESVVASSTSVQAGAQGNGTGASPQSEGDDPITYDSPTDEVIAEGSLNDQIRWRLVRDERGVRTLYVEGTGDMPDYSSSPFYSAARDKVDNIVVGEGITRIGNHAFASLRATGGVSIPSTVTSIGTWAFEYNNFDQEIVVPGTVKTVEMGAFHNIQTLTKITFQEGVETLGSRVLENSMTADGVVVLPSTLVSTDTSWLYMCDAAEYQITGSGETAEGHFVGEDGALYRRTGTEPEAWTLVKYPAGRYATEYVMPEEVTAIDQQALRYCLRLQKVTIPDMVEVTIPNAAFSYSDFSEVSLGAGVTISSMNNLFQECDMLRKVTIADEASCGTDFSAVYSGDHALEEATIPASITSIGSNAFQSCVALHKLVYDAEDVQTFPTTFASGKLRYDLVIGENVQNIGAGFEVIGRYVEDVTFEPNHTFTVEEGAFSSLSSPLANVSGTVHVDANGLVYTLDEDGTASFVYCPPNLTNATVPGTLTVGVKTYTVDTVRRDALKFANALMSITFERPGDIVLLETNALAGCPTLNSVNGATTVENAQKVFSNDGVIIGYGVFNGTGLEDSLDETDFGSNMTGSRELSVEGADKYANLPPLSISVDGSLEWVATEDNEDAGGYQLLTGNSLQIRVKLTISDQPENAAYRVFIHFTSEDGSLSDTFRPGAEVTYGKQVIRSYATKDPYTFCLEFTPSMSGTIDFPVSMFYPSPSSAGGGALIWGEIGEPLKSAGLIDTDGKVKLDESHRPSDDAGMIFAQWTTEQTHWNVNKTAASGTAGMQVVKGDAEGEGRLAGELVWNISHSQAAGSTSGSAGKDYVRYYELVDTLSMPVGMALEADVAEAIEKGEVQVVMTNPSSQRWVATMVAADKPVISVKNTANSDDTPKEIELELNDGGQLEFHFQFENSSGDTVGSSEMNFRNLAITLYPDAVTIDLNEYGKDGTPQIANKADSTIHYQHGDNYSSHKEVTTKLGSGAGSLSVTQTSPLDSDDVAYLGEDVTYTVSLSNPGAMEYAVPESGEPFQVKNTLGQNAYIKPESMEEMFKGQDGDKLEIVIENATLLKAEGGCPAVTPAYGDGSAYQTPTNSDLASTPGHTLTISKTNDGYQLVVDDGESVTGPSVEALLLGAGYDVTPGVTYTCTWTLAEANESYTIPGSTTIDYEVPTTIKNTFQATNSGYGGEYPEEIPITVTNKVDVNRGEKSPDQVSHDFVREAVLGKGYQVYRGGAAQDVSLSGVQDKDVIDYSIDLTHYGNGTYENLPIFDTITGNQRLLVPVDKNPGLEKKNLERVTFGVTTYYVLSVNGIYEDVVVGYGEGIDSERYWCADSITVSDTTTNIVWYIGESPAESFKLSLHYQTIVDTAGITGNFAVGNAVRANDASKGNLWASVTGGGSMIGFSKDIVVSRDGTNPENDTVAADDFSAIERGVPVTYRLKFTNTVSDSYTLKNTDLIDALPNNYGAFTWDGDRITVEVVRSSDEVKNNGWDTNWSVKDEYGKEDYPHSGPIKTNNQQYLCWNKDASLTIPRGDSAYVYVTLSFPDGEGWQGYCDATAGRWVYNALWVCGYESTVSHELSEQGSVLLQKGVYGAYTGIAGSSDISFDGNRYYYSNMDGVNHGAIYYIALVNTGNKRLYVNDIQDYLPRGLSFAALYSTGSMSGGTSNPINTASGSADSITNPFVTFSGLEGGEEIAYKKATITKSGSGRTAVFNVAPAGDGEGSIGYDEELEKCYLEKNEALVFAYRTTTKSEAASSDDTATNLVAMAYSDPSGSGVRLSTEDGLRVTGYEGAAPDGQTNLGSPNDDPLPEIMTTEAFKPESYGFTDEEDNANWLVSDVSLTRGDIIPGITKSAVEVTDPVTGASPQDYSGSAAPESIITWNVRAYNTGNQSMNDYMITDELPAPYTFVGDVIHAGVYNAQGESVWTGATGSMVRIGEHKHGAETVEVLWRDKSEADYIKADGTWYYLSSNLNSPTTGDPNFQMSLSYERGREVLRIRFKFSGRNIQGNGGYSEVQLSSRNMSGTYKNGVYTNYAYLTPLTQEFDATYQGTDTTITANTSDKTEQQPWHSVMASTSINVASGSVAGIQKDIAENDESGKTGNIASSWGQTNAIRLEGEASEVTGVNLTYDFTVTNSTGKTLSNLVMIDNLPRVGDVSAFDSTAARNSEFSVLLADDKFDIRLVSGEGESATTKALTAGTDYTVEYRTDKTPTFTDEDWRGGNIASGAGASGAGAWVSSVTDLGAVTAFRIKLKTKIEDGSRVLVSFKAKTASDAAPDASAWNSFGYSCQRPTTQEGVFDTVQAMTSVVGVRMPTVPTLTKETVNAQNMPVPAKSDATFKFMVYEGDAVSYMDEADLEAKLKEGNRAYKTVELSVSRGQSEAEQLLSPAGRTWEHGKIYSVTELPAMGEGYSFQGIRGTNGSASGTIDPTSRTYTFTYQRDRAEQITCENLYEEWSVALTKVNGDTGMPLNGAAFALYSRTEPATAPTKPAGFESVSDTMRVSGTTYYLYSVVDLESTSEHTWSGLTGQDYYLVEVKTPAGYVEPASGWRLYHSNADSTTLTLEFTVENYIPYELPLTGGSGRAALIGCGAAIAVASVGALFWKRRRGEGGAH